MATTTVEAQASDVVALALIVLERVCLLALTGLHIGCHEDLRRGRSGGRVSGRHVRDRSSLGGDRVLVGLRRGGSHLRDRSSLGGDRSGRRLDLPGALLASGLENRIRVDGALSEGGVARGLVARRPGAAAANSASSPKATMVASREAIAAARSAVHLSRLVVMVARFVVQVARSAVHMSWLAVTVPREATQVSVLELAADRLVAEAAVTATKSAEQVVVSSIAVLSATLQATGGHRDR